MAHSASAKKRIRQNEKCRARNRWRKDQVKDAIRNFTDAIKLHDEALAKERLSEVYKQLDQVAAKGTIHKKTAARRKSRLAVRLAKALAKA